MNNISLSVDLKNCQRVELPDPDRVKLLHASAQATIWVATFTLGCHTVASFGPSRTFCGPNAQAVTHTVWIRTLAEPFDGTVDRRWLAMALEANFHQADDVLAIAMQYLKGAPPVLDGHMKIGGDAGYGPLMDNGIREEGADFNDYLGIPWHHPGSEEADRPEARQLGCLDCSGYMRMIWGFRQHMPSPACRSGVPLCGNKPNGSAMPRRADRIAASGPGIVLGLAQQTRPPPAVLDKLQAGDLVFFNVDRKDDTPGMQQLDHMGMYLGLDIRQQRRFIHSPKSANGPTMGDGPNPVSVLDGNGLYAERLRVIRRL
jgi:cell wall-associated NlpC family hydrolase